MDKDELDFETWFDTLRVMVLDRCGIEFRDQDSVRADYNEGMNCSDVANAIAAEYTYGE